MRVTMLATAVAIALAATIGSVSAGQFTTLNGVKAVPMSSGELGAVKGMDHHFTVMNPHTGVTTRHNTDQFQDANGGGNFIAFVGADGVLRMVAPSYRGLSQACGNGVIDGPGFLC